MKRKHGMRTAILLILMSLILSAAEAGTAAGKSTADPQTDPEMTVEAETPAGNGSIAADEKTNAGAESETAAQKATGAAKKEIRTGFQVINGKTYYYSKKGKRVKSKWITVGKGKKKKQYYFNKKGVMLTGKVKTKKVMYYFREDGVLDHTIDRTKKMIALTYDDGPSLYTPIIVKALKKAGGRATFFVVGERVSTYKKQLKQAFDTGCEIGNHSWDHSYLTSLSSASLLRQIERTNEAVEKVTGKTPVILRPPYGSVNSTVRSYAGMPLILWNEDTLDWKTRNTYSTISEVKRCASDGDIILMHDIHKPTANAAAEIIQWLTSEGYQLVTVSELADCRGKMKDGEKYYQFR